MFDAARAALSRAERLPVAEAITICSSQQATCWRLTTRWGWIVDLSMPERGAATGTAFRPRSRRLRRRKSCGFDGRMSRGLHIAAAPLIAVAHALVLWMLSSVPCERNLASSSMAGVEITVWGVALATIAAILLAAWIAFTALSRYVLAARRRARRIGNATSTSRPPRSRCSRSEQWGGSGR
jgi:hypothetical protein